MDKLGFKTAKEKQTKNNKAQNKSERVSKKDANEAKVAKNLGKTEADAAEVVQESVASFDLCQITSNFKIDTYTKLLLRNCLPWYEKVFLKFVR